MAFEVLPHTADLKIRATGKSLPELFVSAAKGMFSLMVDDPKLFKRGDSFATEVKVKAADHESLLVEWLTELLGISDIENVYLDRFKISELTDSQLAAEISGARVNGFSTEIKAVTYHDLKVEQTPEGYSTEITFDI